MEDVLSFYAEPYDAKRPKVCFDELPPGTLSHDAVTTVRQPAYDIGRVASEMLLRRIGGDTLPVAEVRLDPSLHDPRAGGHGAARMVRSMERVDDGRTSRRSA